MAGIANTSSSRPASPFATGPGVLSRPYIFLTVFNHQSVDGQAKLIVSTGATVTTPSHSYRT